MWKVKSPDYNNKILKNSAYGKLIALIQPIFPNAGKEFVKKKINTIRGCFRKELKKVEASIKSGALAENVYKPSLWYFDLLLFTRDQEIGEKGDANPADETSNESTETQVKNDNC